MQSLHQVDMKKNCFMKRLFKVFLHSINIPVGALDVPGAGSPGSTAGLELVSDMITKLKEKKTKSN